LNGVFICFISFSVRSFPTVGMEMRVSMSMRLAGLRRNARDPIARTLIPSRVALIIYRNQSHLGNDEDLHEQE